MNRSAVRLLLLASVLACAACNDSSPTTASSNPCPTSSVFTDPPALTVDSPCDAEVSEFENATRVYAFIPPATSVYTVEAVYTSSGNADLALTLYDTLTPAGSTSYFLADLLLTCDDGRIGESETCITPTLPGSDSVYLQIGDKQSEGAAFTLTITAGK